MPRPPDGRTTAAARPRVALLALAPVAALLTLVTAPAAPAQAAPSGDVPGHLRGPPVPDVPGHHGQPGPQQHPGEPAGPRCGHRLHVRPAHLPVGRDAQPAQLHAADRVAVPFGNGINGKTPGTNLSRVSNPVHARPSPPSPRCPCSTPTGNPTGSTIAGAVTTTLTAAQVSQAANHQLWVQGGTATDPLGTATFGNRYAFGALRCAIDNLNGDNVEWVGFPSGPDPRLLLLLRRRPAARRPGPSPSPRC